MRIRPLVSLRERLLVISLVAMVLSTTAGDAAPAVDGGEQECMAFGRRVVGLADINGDGKADFAVSAQSGSSKRPGWVRAYSGKDGVLLWSVECGDRVSGRGIFSLCGIGDLDGDSIRDLASCCLREQEGVGETGDLWLLSARTGKTIRVIKSKHPPDFLGAEVAGIGDVNADGVEDIAVSGAIVIEGKGVGIDQVLLLSGRDGSTIRCIDGRESCPEFRTEDICGVGDWDRDGIPDFAMSSSVAAVGDEEYGPTGAVLVISSKTGSVLRQFKAAQKDSRLGTTLVLYAGAGLEGGTDLLSAIGGGTQVLRLAGRTGKKSEFVRSASTARSNFGGAMAWVRRKEGAPLLIVGESGHETAAGYDSGKIYAFGIEGGKSVYEVESDAQSGLGTSLASVGDLDDDGVEEILVGAPAYWHQETPEQVFRGRVHVFSGKTGKLLMLIGPAGREGSTKDAGPK